MVLYPMNALANDQRERLGELHARLSASTGVTFSFGQYVGSTANDAKDRWRGGAERESDRLAGELIFRREMQQSPPDILLTNYSMLEYLLLRPDDSPLFDEGNGSTWRFLVIDEAHQYRGAKGMEMAMLIRRLKQRLAKGGLSRRLVCIATSASLAGGRDDIAAVAQFATTLFDEPLSPDDVILPDVIGRSPSSLPTNAASAAPERLYDALTLQGPTSCDDLFKAIWPHESRDAAEASLSKAVADLSTATDQKTGARRLAPRYHLFLRALEGVFVSYRPEPRLSLERRVADELAWFETAICRECGQHFLVGRPDEGYLRESVRDPGDPDFGAGFYLVQEEGAEPPTDESDLAAHLVCTVCARLVAVTPGAARLPCSHDRSLRLWALPPAKTGEDMAKTCPACGYGGRDPVREVVHGNDGPNAVIATTLYQSLPEGQRKILAFADGRPEAAFFAWYLEDSYKDLLARNLIRQVLAQHGDVRGRSLQTVARDLARVIRQQRLIGSAADAASVERTAALWVLREFLTEEQRLSLEGVGLAAWFIETPQRHLDAAQGVLSKPPLSLQLHESGALLQVLLGTLRSEGAIDLSAFPNLDWRDLDVQRSQTYSVIGAPGGRGDLKSWDGDRTGRARLLTKVLVRRAKLEPAAASQHAIRILRELREALVDADERSQDDERLFARSAEGIQLRCDWWRVRAVSAGEEVGVCVLCARVLPAWIDGCCTRPSCPGLVRAVPAERAAPRQEHYRLLYSSLLPACPRVEEHTAQIERTKAREFQRDFKEKRIHVLSCSTTFELGVDLGDLDTIFLRNVPPESFNYAQRVGRAGRRPGHAGFAVTYCRRTPHDLFHFADPQQMVRGRVQPPILALKNAKIVGRHLFAVLLSAFLRSQPSRFGSLEGFINDLADPRAAADLRAFAESHVAELGVSLRELAPTELVGDLALSGKGWIDLLCGADSRLALAEAELQADIRALRDLMTSASEKGDFKSAQWAKERADTISGEDVLSFLSRKAVIPKYGFPVDVVDLDTQQRRRDVGAGSVSLQRDLSLAVAEFAPGSSVVANKLEWTSHALKAVPGKAWPERNYQRCREHLRFATWRVGESPPQAPCCSEITQGTYVDPLFGFVTERTGPRPPKRKPSRLFSTRPYFVGLAAGDRGSLLLGRVTLWRATPGNMVVLCEGRRGQRFYICTKCGTGSQTRPGKHGHKTHLGRNCGGESKWVSLGHEFVTDTVRLGFPKPEDRSPSFGFAQSLASALTEGAAEVLNVPSDDINAVVDALSTEGGVISIVLYDAVPGGAGLVASLESETTFRKCLEAARVRVAGACGCAEDTSCYGCLRGYRNQFAHRFLVRGPIRAYLDALLR